VLLRLDSAVYQISSNAVAGELSEGGAKVESFLSDLQRFRLHAESQAFNALLFLYREILKQPFSAGQSK